MLRELCIRKKIFGVRVDYFNKEGEKTQVYNSSCVPTKQSVIRVLREYFNENEVIVRNIQYEQVIEYIKIPQESIFYGQDIESEAKAVIK